ncbi:hypothetical protein Tco_0217409 [Tanacetum coccineum]
MKVKESLNVTFDESPPPTKLSPLVDDDVGEEEAIRKNTNVVNNNNKEDDSIEVDEIVNIKESKNHPLDQYIKEMLKKFRLEDSKPNKTPMSTKIKLTKDDEADSMDSSKYLGIKGCYGITLSHMLCRNAESDTSSIVYLNVAVGDSLRRKRV